MDYYLKLNNSAYRAFEGSSAARLRGSDAAEDAAGNSWMMSRLQDEAHQKAKADFPNMLRLYYDNTQSDDDPNTFLQDEWVPKFRRSGGALYPLGGAIPYGSMPYADMEYAKLMYALGGNIPQYIGGGSNNLVETNAYGNPYLDPNSKTDVDEKLKFQYNPEEVVGAGIAATNWGANLLNYDPGLSGQLSDMQTADALNPVISRENAREGTYDPFGNFIDDEKVVAQNKGYNMFGDRGSNLNQGRYGGTPNMQYKQGGEYDLSKPEIDAIIKAGGEVEYL